MKIGLYWVTSVEPEDWFIVAPNEAIAENSYECAEGMNEGDANATLVCEVPAELEAKYRDSEDDIVENGYWPSLKLLKALGFQFIENSPPYILKKDGVIFSQGGGCYAIMLSIFDYTGVYVVNIRNTNQYKIGYTKDLARRIKNLKTGNPFSIDLHFFIITQQTMQIERELHTLLSDHKIGGEWFEIDDRSQLVMAIGEVSLKHNIIALETYRLIGR